MPSNDVLKKREKIFIFFLLSISIYLLGYYYFGELVDKNNGVGWDGEHYAAWATSFDEYLLKKKISLYHIRRILPSFLVFALNKLTFHYETTFITDDVSNKVLVKSPQLFYYMNSILLLTSVYYWYKFLNLLKLKKNSSFILSFFLLFINFAVLKEQLWQPVNTDTTALFLGILTLYYYTKKNSVLLLITSIIGAFVWPTALPLGLLLFIL